MSTFNQIRKTLQKTLISSPVAALITHQNDNKVSLPGFGAAAAFDFLNNFDWNTHPAEQINQSFSAAIIGTFFPHMVASLLESCIGDPQVSLGLALLITTFSLKTAIDLCDKLESPIQTEIIVPKSLTAAEIKEQREIEIKLLEKRLDDSLVREAQEDKVLEKIFASLRPR